MRCEQGDTAVIVSNVLPQNVDKLVTCLRLLEPVVGCDGGVYIEHNDLWFPYDTNGFTGPVWLVETLGSDLVMHHEDTGEYETTRTLPVADKDLRPLRDTDGEDQMPRVTDRELTT